MGYLNHDNSTSYPLVACNEISAKPTQPAVELVHGWPPKPSSYYHQNAGRRACQVPPVAQATATSSYVVPPRLQHLLYVDLVLRQSTPSSARQSISWNVVGPGFKNKTREWGHPQDEVVYPRIPAAGRKAPLPRYPPGLGYGPIGGPMPSSKPTEHCKGSVIYSTRRPLTPGQQLELDTLKRKFSGVPKINSPLRELSFTEALFKHEMLRVLRADRRCTVTAFHRDHDEAVRFLPFCRQGGCSDVISSKRRDICVHCKSEEGNGAKSRRRKCLSKKMNSVVEQAFEDPASLRLSSPEDYLAFAKYVQYECPIIVTIRDTMPDMAGEESLQGEFDDAWVEGFWSAMKMRFMIKKPEPENQGENEEKKEVTKN